MEKAFHNISGCGSTKFFTHRKVDCLMYVDRRTRQLMVIAEVQKAPGALTTRSKTITKDQERHVNFWNPHGHP
eukprot:1224357-Amphidinium_carterae.1